MKRFVTGALAAGFVGMIAAATGPTAMAQDLTTGLSLMSLGESKPSSKSEGGGNGGRNDSISNDRSSNSDSDNTGGDDGGGDPGEGD